MEREAVRKSAPWFIYNFQDLIDELDHALLPQQQKQQEEPEEEMYSATADSTYQVSDSDALCASPMHVEEIGVKAS